ncbi:sulfatase-like hydrolase/transferase [Rhodopirellula sp. MGV]|uniref:sulfatase-like hydrolase/transferase n=1 Tax=Rhodopirellula sp. MGV TaxID=2023130 RepID=UPI000B95EC8E|nr:sulfatase-like hydrolase/transferase [Rhodopirellula sp. MGV]OYP33945.1 N-acetylgalactosamine 6-sulfate sulfatase [Rhodopirellula sp. MGV]PNY34074.1 N-acetylgalactosamine 6-sulfate sulfatase [Rhodopirellula baltica]
MRVLFALVVLAAAWFPTARSRAASPPNLILIIADDLGYGDVSYQGAPDLKTPRIDQLASEGIRFNNMRANCTVCSPTRAAIMTGRYADRSGVPGVIRTNPENNWGYLSPTLSTLADRLQSAGYHTGAVGKWHLGLEAPNVPTERGFDFFHGFLGDMMDDYYTHLRGGINFMRLGTKVIEPEGHATDLFTDWAIEFVKQRSTEPQQPFFLYLAYNAPHFPIQPPNDWLKRTQQANPGMDLKRAQNVALVEHLDHNVGRFLDQLDELGLRENTVVAFTSDNGGSLPHAQRNLPWRDGKQSHYDGGLRVPFIIRTPVEKLAGTESDYVGLNFDLHATFVELAGANADSDTDAVSLTSILRGESMGTEPRELYFVRREGNNRYVGGAYHAVIRGKWKLLRNDPYSPLELYDLEADPYETNDVIRTTPRIANELKGSLRRHIQLGGQVPWQAPPQ